MSRLLEDRTIKLKGQLDRLIHQQEPLNISTSSTLENLYEDLHWLVLISGHVLCLESVGETALVPSEIMHYSMEQQRQGHFDINLTLQLLASPGSDIGDITGAEQSADHMIRLIAGVFRLAEVAKRTIAANASHHLSPELCSTVVWFLHRWSLSYLLPKESYYAEISPTLLQAFGEDTPGAQWSVTFVLEQIQCYLNAFKGEPKLVKGLVDLLTSLVDTSYR